MISFFIWSYVVTFGITFGLLFHDAWSVRKGESLNTHFNGTDRATMFTITLIPFINVIFWSVILIIVAGIGINAIFEKIARG